MAEDCFIHQEGEAKGGAYFLISQLRNRVLQVNQTIADFVALLKTAHSKEDLLQLLDGQANENVDQQITDFLRELYRLGIIRKESDAPSPPQDFFFKSEASIGDYTVIKGMSAGPWTQLYEVEDKRTQKAYILKLFNYTQSEITTALLQDIADLFAKEFELMARLKHPHICRLFHFSNSVRAYGVIEKIEGVHLKKYTETLEDLSLAERLISQLLSAFAYLHQHRILHGDIHYRNVLVNTDDQIKVIDFGFSYPDHQINDKEAWHGGVPKFIPPERVRDHSYSISKKVGDFRSEVFQLGMLLYYLMAGEPPFSGTIWKELAEAIQHQVIKSIPLRYAKALDPRREEIILKALAKRPEDRYADAQELYQHWRQTFDGQTE
ncbi:MAG: serine/threonine-protein kinase [Bacteroidota bacterium]